MKHFIANIKDPNWVIKVLFGFLVVAFIVFSRKIILYTLFGVVWAFIVAYLLSPIVVEFEKREWPRFISVLIIWLVIVILIVVIIALLIPIFMKQISLITIQWETFNAQSELSKKIIDFIPVGIQQVFLDYWVEMPVVLQRYINELISSDILDKIALIVVIPVLSFYMMLEREKWYLALLHMFPSGFRSNATLLGRRLNIVIGKWIRGQILLSSIVFIATFIGLSFIGVKYVLLLSTVNSVLNFVPYFGAIIGILVTVFITFLTNVELLWTVIFYVLGVAILKSMLLSPIIIGRRINQKPAAVLISLLIGWQFMGVVGFLIAVPALVLLKLLVSFGASMQLKRKYPN